MSLNNESIKGIEFLNQENGLMFDSRDPKIKRREFNSQRNKLLEQLLQERGERCQLELSENCEGKLVLDHQIPISSNEVNKHIRHIKPEKGKKIPSESFGSNHPDNLLIACEKCNSFKKHRFVKKNAQGEFEILNLVGNSEVR